MTEHLLSINLLIALVGLFCIALTKRAKGNFIKTTAAIVTGLQFWIMLEILFNFDPLETALQFSERINWISAFRIDYYLGIDGINLIFLLITSLLIFLSVIISWNKNDQIKEYFILLMFMNIGLNGIFSAINLFLFAIFLGVTFFAVYLLIGLNNSKNETYLANRIGIPFLLSYILILLGLILLYNGNNLHTLNLTELIAGNTISQNTQMVITIIFLIGFAILIPLFPFHSWLIPVIKNLPAEVGMLILGIMTKIGVYGLVRIIAPVMPFATNSLALALGIWGLVNIIYGAICALGTDDSDQILGYFTLQQLGFFLIGFATIAELSNIPIAVTGLSGGLLIVISHTCLATLLLIIFKSIIPDSRNVARSSPTDRTVVILALLAGIGMPGFLDFFARFTILLSAFQSQRLLIIAILSLVGILLNFGVYLKLFKRLVFNQPTLNSVKKLDSNEIFVAICLLIVLISFGLFPGFLLNVIQPGVTRLLEMFSAAIAL
ncbi:MAG TPA: NADH-quinone oxidoreductase subunit M [Candidatus Marinimicrobia bacterium]|nr:NADH-quinone oxidoreductase subunit M [Candidatus Neomarinimicrobiota bacterium]HRS51586.1 NADH-quinone oxidoreductase subunit M [Candidatus Neomarinimicrobiota bacterium]HRU92336.1 NADH-quinone oxidoreductase subunit M [Candidatus Neomarinimicrobiota bacterium]